MQVIQGGFTAIRRIGGGVRLRAIWSAVDAGIGPFSALVMAAGLLRALGTHSYGLMVMALAVSNLSTAINPAIVSTTTKFVSEAVGSGAVRTFGVARIVSGSLFAIVVIDVLFVVGALLFGSELVGLVFGAGASGTVADLRVILILAVLAICIQQIDAVLAATLRGLEKFGHQAAMEVCCRIALVGSVVAVAFATRSVRAALVAYCCAYGTSALVRAIVVRVASPEKRLFALPEKADLRRLLIFGGWMWLNALATIPYGTLDRILIGRFFGAGAAAHFSVYTQLTQLVHLAPASLFSFVYPMFSRLRSEQGPIADSIVRLYRNSFRGCILISGSILVLLAAFGSFLAHVLGGRAFQPSETVLLLLGLSYFLLTFNIVPFYFLLGIGRSRGVSLVNSLSMAAAVLLMTVLIPAYGETGAALSRFAYGFGALTLLFQSRKALRN
jgi:O-antigen/teichoic acid export membrane protein